MTKNSSHNSGPQKAFWKTKPISDMSHSEWESCVTDAESVALISWKMMKPVKFIIQK